MAPTTHWQDYARIVVVGAGLMAFVFAVSSTYRTTPPSSSISASSSSSGPSSNTLRASSKSKSRTSSSSQKPNVVFIMADDLGWNGIGYEDWKQNEYPDKFALQELTPNLQGMASAGISFTNYYSQEVCTPARAAFLTGRYPISTGMQYGVVEQYAQWGLNLSETTLAQVFKDNGYDAHAIGKWHLGHHTARYLPTARGFDSFTGYLDGDNYYWSKENPTYNSYLDFTVANSTCYGPSANESSYSLYSTTHYRDLAIQKLFEYKDTDIPLFLYIAFQAVHNPYYDPLLADGDDYRSKSAELAANYSFVKETAESNIEGEKAQLYALTLNILDSAVASIVDALTDYDMLDNTVVIFASDNGGCVYNGGRNYPLKGSKASLYEGGTHVDAFVYSPTLLKDYSGTTYQNLFHVSDWFPTILDMADITYEPASGYALDGVSHLESLENINNDDYTAANPYGPRLYMLYNAYTNIVGANDADDYGFDVWKDGIFAIRDNQYKLIHSYNGSSIVCSENDDNVYDDDWDLSAMADCKQQEAYSGSYSMELYDIVNDPYETTNLYYDSSYETIRTTLYSQLFKLNDVAANCYFVYQVTLATGTMEELAEATWDEHGTSIGPYVSADTDVTDSVESLSYPSYCGSMIV